MLNPGIVQVLLWVFKSGLIAGPILLMWLRWSPRAFSAFRAVAAVLLVWVTVAFTGWILGFIMTTITYTVLCAFFYGFLKLIDRRNPATLSLLLPLGAGCACVAWIYSQVVADADNPLVPWYKQRLNAQLICRGYPKWNDSIPVTRLVLLRETDGINDVVLANIDGHYRTDCMSCSLQPDGTAHLSLRACDGTWKLDKQVPLNTITPLR